MHYIILTKLEYPTSISLRVKGLRENEMQEIIHILDDVKAKYSNSHKDFFEVDLTAVEMLNILADDRFGYKIHGQSMAMENSTLGGRTFQIEKIAWTLGK